MLLSRGLGDKAIARELGISDLTARTHRAQMLRRAHTPNVCALLFLSLNSGWLTIADDYALRTAFDEWSNSSDEKKMTPADADFPPASTRRK